MKTKALLGTLALALTLAGSAYTLQKTGILFQDPANFTRLSSNSFPGNPSSENPTSEGTPDPAQVALKAEQTYTLTEKAPLFTCYRALRMANAYLQQPDPATRQAGLAKLVKAGEMTWNPDVKRQYTFDSCADGSCQYIILHQASSRKTFYAYRQSIHQTVE